MRKEAESRKYKAVQRTKEADVSNKRTVKPAVKGRVQRLCSRNYIRKIYGKEERRDFMKRSVKLTISKAGRLIKKALDIYPIGLKPEKETPGCYSMKIGNLFIEVGEFGEVLNFPGEYYYKLVIGIAETCDFLTFIYDRKTLERDMIAEMNYQDSLMMLRALNEDRF